MKSQRVFAAAGLVCGLLPYAGSLLPGAADPARAEVWTFDRLDKIAGHAATMVGHPRVIGTPLGKAVLLNGTDDALFIDSHPLAGAETFTAEAFFRPDRAGAPEQRWFHLAEQDPATKADTGTRLLFEIRVVDDKWCLDSFAQSGNGSLALMDRQRLHPLDAWYHVAMVYDGKEFSNYVNGVMEGKGAVHLVPQGQGHTSVGVRINRVNYFKGAVRQARFSRRALTPAEFLKLPAKLRSMP